MKRNLSLFLKAISLFFLFLFLGLFSLFIIFAKDLPRPEKFTERAWILPTKIYDRTGEILLYEIYGEEKRKLVSLDVVPEYLKQAVVLKEDADFYSHLGIDFKGILRAFLVNLRLQRFVQGGSTIPQQLIRSSSLTREKTLKRKTREIILSIELDRRYSKEQILEWYLNQVPFGSNAYGVESASQAFFEKPVSEISIAEAAILTSLIQAPSYLSPYGEHKEELLKEKDGIIEKMLRQGFISGEEAKIAKEEEIEFAEPKISILDRAPHFTLHVKSLLEEKYGEEFLRRKGLSVFTTLDWELQKAAQEAVERWIKRNEAFYAFNVSLVAIDPKTGQVLAMIGSKDWGGEPFPEDCSPGKDCLFDPMVNVAFRERQPGSAFKPFVYTTAFEKGFSDSQIVIDEETNFGIWGGEGEPYIPQNYDGKFRGPVTLRQALAQSLNVPSVKVLVYLAGIEDSLETAKKFGITTLKAPSFYGPSLVLGAGEVKLLDMVSAFGVFATKGFEVSPSFILEIKDDTEDTIFEEKKTPKRVLESGVANLINDILSDNEARAPMFGSNSPLYFKDRKVAAKTGTTQNYEDLWTIGYSFGPKPIAAGVWVGNNNRVPMAKQPGVVLAGPIWHDFMEKALFFWE